MKFFKIDLLLLDHLVSENDAPKIMISFLKEIYRKSEMYSTGFALKQGIVFIKVMRWLK